MTDENKSINRRGPYVGFCDPTQPSHHSPLAPPPPPKPGSLGDLLKKAIDKANERRFPDGQKEVDQWKSN